MLFAEGFTFRNFLIDVFGIGVLVPSKVTSKSHLRVIAAFLKSRDQRKRVEMRFAHLKIHHGFERCGCEVFPARAMSSFSPPPCRTSRRWRSDYSGRHPPGSAHRLPEIAHASVSRVRVEVAANQAAAKPNSRLISAGSKPITGITPTGKPTF